MSGIYRLPRIMEDIILTILFVSHYTNGHNPGQRHDGDNK